MSYKLTRCLIITPPPDKLTPPPPDELTPPSAPPQRENELLRAANQKLTEISSDTEWQREQQETAAQLRAKVRTGWVQHRACGLSMGCVSVSVRTVCLAGVVSRIVRLAAVVWGKCEFKRVFVAFLQLRTHFR